MTVEDFGGVGGGPDIEKELVDPEHLRKIQRHPCFGKEAAHRFGRIHLPVVPKCNIQCNYCIRDFDCVNESRPGVTSQMLTPGEAYERVKEVVEKFDNIGTVGIAGPGEPLANDVITRKAGPHAAAELKNAGIELIQDYSPIDVAIKRQAYYA